MEIPGPIPLVGNPPLGYRFAVVFFIGGVLPNPIDTMFQKVSGLESTIETTTVEEGGQNLYTQRLPKKIQHENLVLERGVFIGSPLVIELNIAVTLFKFAPSNVLVSLLDDSAIPLASWMFLNAYPVKWSVSDLNAEQNSVVIEHMEFTYQHMLILRV